MRLLQVYFLIVGTSLVRASATPALQGINLDQWRLLNATVGGRLHSATPMALPCFSKFKNNTVKVDVQACSEIESNYTSPEFRLQRYSANMNVRALSTPLLSQMQWFTYFSPNMRRA